MTKLMDLECTAIQMAQVTKANGKMTSNMVLELNHGQMVLSTKAFTVLDASMVSESISGATNLHTQVNGKIIRQMESVSIHGQMAAAMRASGVRITWRDQASTTGAMDVCTSDNTWMIKNTDMEFIAGKTAESTKVFGIKGSSMGQEFILSLRMLLSLSLDCGRMAKESNGSQRTHRKKSIQETSIISNTSNCLKIKTRILLCKSSINPTLFQKNGQTSI